jgi:hypothetical protein
MKKTYQKPTLVRRECLTRNTAFMAFSNQNGSGNGGAEAG